MKYLRKIIHLGNKLLIEEHPAPALGKNHQRPPRESETTTGQRKLNDKYTAKKLRYKIICNFIPFEDLFLTLEHPPSVSEENAKKAISIFLDLMRKYHKKKGTEFKYILVNEKQGCWHHHLITKGIPLEVIRGFWKKATKGMRREEESRVYLSTLDPFDDYKSLAEYLISEEKPSRKKNPTPEEKINAKQPRRKGARRYTCSKNLDDPEIEIKELMRITKTEPKPPKGYKLIGWNKWCDDYGEMHAEYECVWAQSGPPPKCRKKKPPEVRKRE